MDVSTAKKQKVLFCITKANWGGAQRYVYDLATGARDAGYEVAVAYGTPGELGRRLQDVRIRTVVIPSLSRDISPAADWRVFLALKDLIERERPDVLHLNSSKIGGLGALAGRIARVPHVIFTDHGWAFTEARSWPMRTALWLISWVTVLLVDRVIAVSDYELALTERMPFAKRKAVRIYNGIDLDMRFGSGDVIRRAFPAGVRITGTVGELTKNKNQIALVEKAKDDPGLYVAIVGEGELRPVLERKIAQYGLERRVKLFGFHPAVEVMRGFDYFALPSIKEALAYVVLEARAAGLPIAANRVGGVAEALEKPLAEFSKERMVGQTLALYTPL